MQKCNTVTICRHVRNLRRGARKYEIHPMRTWCSVLRLFRNVAGQMQGGTKTFYLSGYRDVQKAFQNFKAKLIRVAPQQLMRLDGIVKIVINKLMQRYKIPIHHYEFYDLVRIASNRAKKQVEIAKKNWSETARDKKTFL